MSANTQWFIKVQKIITETVEISAITENDAILKAMKLEGVIGLEEIPGERSLKWN